MITAIIPAYNEEKTIGSVVLGTQQHVSRVIVVDDGSSDQTSQIAKLAGAEVLVHPVNQGKGAALKTGFEAAKDSKIIVTLDSDGQHDTGLIPKLVKPIQDDEADVVNGSRYLHGKDDDTPAYRRVGQNVLDAATNISGHLKITDSQSGFRAFAGHTIPVFGFHSSGYTIESEMLIDAANAGLRIMEVEIEAIYGEDSHHKANPVKHGVSVLLRIIRDMEYNRPLYYFGAPGAVMVLIGMVLSIIFFSEYITDQSPSLLPTAMAALLTIFGSFIAFTGLILHSISRMIKREMHNM
ncbi:MAG: glycosyltransferase family 2 protein [Methanobacterium sp.]|jgi:glycosyltransferase involved in cell wall biosynthesis